MQPFEFYKLAKDNLLDARLQQVANFLAEQNDTASVVSIVHNLIKVDYKNSPYFKRNKDFWRDIETPLDRITPKEFTVNPLQDDKAFMQELKFQYNNRFSKEGNLIKKYVGDSPYHAISGRGKSIATFADCKTLGDCQKKVEALGILKPKHSLNNIKSGKYSLNDFKDEIAYNINAMTDTLKAQENFKKWITSAEQTISELKNNNTRGNKND